ISLLARGRISEDEADTQLGQLNTDLEVVREEITHLESRMATGEPNSENIDSAARAIRSVQQWVEEVEATDNRERKVRVIRAMVAKVIAVTEVRDGKKH